MNKRMQQLLNTLMGILSWWHLRMRGYSSNSTLVLCSALLPTHATCPSSVDGKTKVKFHRRRKRNRLRRLSTTGMNSRRSSRTSIELSSSRQVMPIEQSSPSTASKPPKRLGLTLLPLYRFSPAVLTPFLASSSSPSKPRPTVCESQLQSFAFLSSLTTTGSMLTASRPKEPFMIHAIQPSSIPLLPYLMLARPQLTSSLRRRSMQILRTSWSRPPSVSMI